MNKLYTHHELEPLRGYRNASQSYESEGALMAKRVAKKAKPKRRKRETNAERVLREFERRSEFGAAKSFADRIREGMEKNRKGMESEAELPTEWLPTKDEAYLWKTLCQPRS